LEPIKLRSPHGPEWKIQKDFITFVEARHWNVERMIGNMYQFGIPDIFIAHKKHGDRWIDLKNPMSYDFTLAQIRKWPVWEAHGTKIWIITGNFDYPKLFEPPNWREYWKPRYDDIPTVDEILEGLE
jgi:hypothetical protein